MREAEQGPVGLLLIDKPSGPTSHDVVSRLRAVLGTRRVGHAGTLDPMATGLLVCAVGRATKLLGHLALADKTYTATIRLGQGTSTDDAEGEVVSTTPASAVTTVAARAAMEQLRGDIQQVPSAVSAIKVEGQRAYARVRAGEEVILAPRPVTIRRFELAAPIKRYDDVLELDVVVECTTGTYIRALARDLGELLGVGGHLTALRRERVGPFEVAGAAELYPDGPPPRARPGEPRQHPPITDETRGQARAAMIEVAAAARAVFEVRTLTAAERHDLRHGRPIMAVGIAGTYACVDASGELIALVEDAGERARPVLVWHAAG